MTVPVGRIEPLADGRFKAVIEYDHGEESYDFALEREAATWLDQRGAWQEQAE